jgi:hypothetical protein
VDEGGEADRTDDVAHERERPHGCHLARAHPSGEEALEHHHDVAREELGAGEHHEREGDAEHAAHDELGHRRRRCYQRTADGEQQHDGDADVRAGEKRCQQVARYASGLFRFDGGLAAELAERFGDGYGHGILLGGHERRLGIGFGVRFGTG